MATFIRLLVGACVAVVALAMLAGVAVALRSVQVSNPGARRDTGANISFEEEGRFLRTVCSGVTLSGTGNARIAKSTGNLAGETTRGETTGCRAFGFVEAAVTIEAEAARPFRWRYQSILGTLPIITGILALAEGARFTISAGGRICRYEGRAGALFPVVRVGGSLVFEQFLWLSEPKMRIVAGSTRECPSEGSLFGQLSAERRRTITLI
jgi:hypothetical protein